MRLRTVHLFEANPDLLRKIARGMCELIPKNIENLAGLEMGGIPLVTAISLDAGIQYAFVRKKAKEYGTYKFAEGVQVSGRNICIIEDMVATEGQIIKSANMLRKVGAMSRSQFLKGMVRISL